MFYQNCIKSKEWKQQIFITSVKTKFACTNDYEAVCQTIVWYKEFIEEFGKQLKCKRLKDNKLMNKYQKLFDEITALCENELTNQPKKLLKAWSSVWSNTKRQDLNLQRRRNKMYKPVCLSNGLINANCIMHAPCFGDVLLLLLACLVIYPKQQRYFSWSNLAWASLLKNAAFCPPGFPLYHTRFKIFWRKIEN